MGRRGRRGATAAAVMLAALLGLALGATAVSARAVAAGGAICIELEWAMTPAGAEAGFIVANRSNTVWRSVFVPTANGRGMACEADLPADRYLVCEVAYGGYAIQLLPAPGQAAYETCLGLNLADGQAATTAFRNVPSSPSPSAAPSGQSLPGLPNTGGGGMAMNP